MRIVTVLLIITYYYTFEEKVYRQQYRQIELLTSVTVLLIEFTANTVTFLHLRTREKKYD